MKKSANAVSRESMPTPSAALQQGIARSLAEGVADDLRLGYARSFVYATLQACWKRCCVSSKLQAPSCALPRLHSEAGAVAEQLGAALAELDAPTVMHQIGSAYTAALPTAFRAVNGIFYTPPAIVECLLDMAENAGVDWTRARILDPACGGGAFLAAVAARIANSLRGTDPSFVLQQLGTRLRGFELDPFGAWLSQRMLELVLADVRHEAERDLPRVVEQRDSLDLQPEDFGKFDLIIGNPPYGRISLAPERRKKFARSVYGHANLYGLFTDAAIHWTKGGGVIAYVTPTSMLSGLYFKSLRALLSEEAPPLVVNFIDEREGVFADVLQETMLAAYRRNGHARGPRVGFIDGSGKITRTRKTEAFALPSRSYAPWLLPRSPDQSSLTRRLWWMPHRLRDYEYEVSTGPLVWNRHKDQFRTTESASARPVIWAESITAAGKFLWRSAKRNHAPWFVPDGSRDNWLIVNRACVLLQRTTAKEQERRLIAAELPQSFIRKHKGVVIENHVNMIRPVVSKPKLSPAIMAALFNSTAVDAAFRCINGSVAVSAFELEELPLPSPVVMDRLRELVAANAPCSKVERVIARAYRLDDASSSS